MNNSTEEYIKQMFCPNCNHKTLTINALTLGEKEFKVTLKCDVCKMYISTILIPSEKNIEVYKPITKGSNIRKQINKNNKIGNKIWVQS